MNPNPTANANPKYIPHSAPLQTTDAELLPPDNGVNLAQVGAVAARQVVEGIEANVEARRRAVKSDNMDRLAVEGRGPARAAVGAVPLWDGIRAADVGEALDLALSLPE
jgi:hypothetical protein